MISRLPVIYTAAGVLALVCGVSLATGSWLWPAIAAGVSVILLLAWAEPAHFDAKTLTVLLVGYMVGNRGFAQLSPVGGVPLFPAELGLMIGMTMMIWRCSRVQSLPKWGDALSVVLLFWMAMNAARFVFDLREHGFDALRDFALVYYAGFFFIARYAAQNISNEWPMRSVRWASLVLLPLSWLVEAYPTFFYETLTLRGAPLIFIKGDLLGLFMAVGVLLWWRHYEENPERVWALVISLALALGVFSTDNRASMLGLAIGVSCLAMAGSWKLVRVLTVAGVLGGLAMVCWAYANGRTWKDTPVYQVSEAISSMADLAGEGGATDFSDVKADNNRFRTTWWRTVVNETIATNPWLGMGFGHSLSDGFLKEFYPGESTNFLARSPHNVLITIFARTGLVGLLGFLSFLGILMHRTKLVAANRERHNMPLWASAWVILTGACFGVVLEGPMGAVFFWIFLGVAAERFESERRSGTAIEKTKKT